MKKRVTKWIADAIKKVFDAVNWVQFKITKGLYFLIKPSIKWIISEMAKITIENSLAASLIGKVVSGLQIPVIGEIIAWLVDIRSLAGELSETLIEKLTDTIMEIIDVAFDKATDMVSLMFEIYYAAKDKLQWLYDMIKNREFNITDLLKDLKEEVIELFKERITEKIDDLKDDLVSIIEDKTAENLEAIEKIEKSMLGIEMKIYSPEHYADHLVNLITP